MVWNGSDYDQSMAERKLLEAFNKIGFFPIPQMNIGPFRSDLVFPEHKLVVEVDGPEHDKKKDEYLRKNGWEVKREKSTYCYNYPDKAARQFADYIRILSKKDNVKRIYSLAPDGVTILTNEQLPKVKEKITKKTEKRIPSGMTEDQVRVNEMWWRFMKKHVFLTS